MKQFVEIFGWYGTAAIMAAYFLVSFSIIESVSFWYQFLNLTGAMGIIAVSSYKKVWQSVSLNIVWGLIALVAIMQILV